MSLLLKNISLPLAHFTLKADLEKSDYNVLSLGTLKKIDDIDRLAKRIRDRLKR